MAERLAITDSSEQGRDGEMNRYDAAFVAHARADVPALLAEVERLTAERDAARTQRDEAVQALRVASNDANAAEAEVERLRGVIRTMIASAVPHPIEHPTMTQAWADARAVLGEDGES
jgi:hypothetical protein